MIKAKQRKYILLLEQQKQEQQKQDKLKQKQLCFSSLIFQCKQ